MPVMGQSLIGWVMDHWMFATGDISTYYFLIPMHDKNTTIQQGHINKHLIDETMNFLCGVSPFPCCVFLYFLSFFFFLPHIQTMDRIAGVLGVGMYLIFHLRK